MNQLLGRFRSYARPYRWALLGGAVLTILDVVVSLAEPWPLRFVVDDVLRPTDGAPVSGAKLRLLFAVAALMLLVVAGSAIMYWSTRLLSSAGLRIANDLRIAVLSRLQRQSLRYHGAHRVGDLTARVTSDVSYTQDMIVQLLAVLLPNMLLILGMIIVMLALDPTFTLLALIATPPMAFAIHRARMRLRIAARGVRKADGGLASAASESLAAIHLVQAFTLEDERMSRFSELSETSLDAGLESVRMQSWFAPLVELASVLSTAVVLWFGALRVLNGHLSLGVLLVFLSYLGSLYKPVRQLSKLSTVASKGAAAAERIEELLAAPLDIIDRPGARARRLRGEIELRSVTFSYGREPVLTDLSMKIEPGQQIAVVGPTGAGKSTLASLIPRLVDVDSGEVLVDGIDVRDHQLQALRGQIATVLQDTTLFDGTLRDNIICGQTRATGHGVRRAARLALVDEFASRLPDGLDTHVGERGVNLSGGQRQRVAIARAILRDAPILILDEPTSALDAESEELLLEALNNLPQGRTRLTIAHRLSTIRTADQIFVMDRGQIVQAGTHAELISLPGTYQRLTSLQTGHVRLVEASRVS